jgi:acyl-[acyl-carrier-protein]-phospholipid O-acyltransferase/long-chain-fatty-acid--[acyl-carrier-protein] ligase
MILTATVLGCLVAAYVAAALALMVRLRISLRQALAYLPLKLTLRIDDRAIATARAAQAPVIYVVIHRSRLEPALMLSLLPDDTLHILDPSSAATAWLEPWRALGRTIVFNAEHVFVSRRLVQILKRKGRIAVYLPDEVEPDSRAFRLYRAISRIALQADARVVTLAVEGSQQFPAGRTGAQAARIRSRWLPRLVVGALPGRTITELVADSLGGSTTGSNALFDRVAAARSATAAAGQTAFTSVRQAARRFGADAPAVEDPLSGAMSYRHLLIGARIFGARFARITAPGEVVGVLLPNSNGLAVTLLGLWSAGRAASPINHTAGAANVTAAMRMVAARLTISSHAFVEKAGLEEIVAAAQAGGARILWLEDLRAGITGFDRATGWLSWRSAIGRQDPAAAAVVLFSSGSEGLPKAIQLSHANLVSNAQQVEARLSVGPPDQVLAVLPAFHALGLLGGIVLPLITGVRTFLYPSPLHFRQIPKLAARIRPTAIFATDTFLAAYAKAAEDGDFASLRFAVAGAEPLRRSTCETWRARFGVPLLEGYGMTEASPVVALNSATHRRDGTVGRQLPGMRGRIEPVEGIADAGRLWIWGPNVMAGTIDPDRPGTLCAVPEGWHDTGDIVSVDRDGFVTLRGRARRFAKIAGEMVSLTVVEALAEAAWPESRHAAVALPDPRRGERIVLVTTEPAPDPATLRVHGRRLGAPDIAQPDAILTVAEIPLLGSGKVDHAAVLRLADGGKPAAAVA